MMSVVFIRSYVFSLTALVFSGLLEGGVIRVKSGVDVLNVASGSDWHADVTNLQRALSLAVDGDEIWVAAGTYYPDEGQGQVDDDRYSVFRLKSGVVLYGGFQGNESDSSKRNPAANETILSGDINQDESGFSSGYTPSTGVLANSYHVVWAEGTSSALTQISGFTITAGCAWQGGEAVSDEYRCGGGIYSEFATIQITDCLFRLNYAEKHGGALYLGMQGAASPSVYQGSLIGNCIFEQNKGYWGGAVASRGASPEFRQCQFLSNGYALGFSGLNGSSIGAGNIHYDYSSVGGAILSNDDSLLRVSNSTFSANTANAVYASNSSLLFEGDSFTMNESEGGGSAISARASVIFGGDPVTYSLVVYNCLFSGNISTNHGAGAIAAKGALRISLTNCTFTQNEFLAGIGHGSLYLAGVETQLSNLIVWGNLTRGNSDIPDASDTGNSSALVFIYPSINYSDFEATALIEHSLIGSSKFHLSDTTNLNGSDPGNAPDFIDASDFRLSSTSPAIGAGSNLVDLDGGGSGLGTIADVDFDLLGNPRVGGQKVDMGAYEFVYSGDFLDSDSDGLPDQYERSNGKPPSDTSLDPTSDGDYDGHSALEEFLFGGDLLEANAFTPVSSFTEALVFIPNDDYDPFDPSGSGSPGVLENRDFFTLSYSISREAIPFVNYYFEKTNDLSDPTSWDRAGLLVYAREVDSEDSAKENFNVRSLTPEFDEGQVFIRMRIEPK